MLERFVNVDHQHREALVAVFDGDILGVARYDALADPVLAEVAFVVEDAHQGKGIATLLLHRLADAAAERGITEFRAMTLAENREMRNVFLHSGYAVAAHSAKDDPSVIEFSFPIGGAR